MANISPTWPLAELDGLGGIFKAESAGQKLAKLIIELNQQAKLAQHGRRIGWAWVNQQDKLARPS
jgi:hypothetical protein